MNNKKIYKNMENMRIVLQVNLLNNLSKKIKNNSRNKKILVVMKNYLMNNNGQIQVVMQKNI